MPATSRALTAAVVLLVGVGVSVPAAASPLRDAHLPARGAGAVHVLRAAPVAACSNATRLKRWRLRRLAEQTVVVPAEETDVAAVTRQVAAGAGGVILFGSAAPASLGRALSRLSRVARGGIAPLVMTDEEGGAVQRMANLVGDIPAARTMADTMTPRQIRRLAHRAGLRMRAAGVTMDLAPVLDLDGRPGPSATNPDGTRSFSPHRRVATTDGLAFATGLRRAGVVPVVKHFPGLGGATANTDVAPAATRPWPQLRRNGLRPFAAAVANGFPAVMVANATVPGLARLPATLSPAVVRRVLRRRLGFSGLVITDSLSAVAIRDAGFGVPSASVQALRVGVDLVEYGAAPSQVGRVTRSTVHAIVAAVRSGRLPARRLRAAVLHVLAVKHVDLCALAGR